MNAASTPPSERQLYSAMTKILDKQLTDTQKCYIIMYYKEGLTMGEIAKLRGVTTSTVSRTVKRAETKLRQLRLTAGLISGGSAALSEGKIQ